MQLAGLYGGLSACSPTANKAAEDNAAIWYINNISEHRDACFHEPGGMWGIYIAGDRSEIAEKDPAGLAFLEAFSP